MTDINKDPKDPFLLKSKRPHVLLAPMAGVSDVAFRTLCREQGADMAFTEMVSAKGLSYSNEKTRRLLALADGESCVGVQLFGHEPFTLAQQAAWIENTLGASLAWIDINMGCPARKITSKGDGAALMRTPDLAVNIVREVKSAIMHPVTVKFRRGWDEDNETACDFACHMEEAGADAIVIHGRYATQFYRGKCEWEVIGRVKNAVGIPVVGNGDIKTGSDAKAMIEKTACDHIMIARAAEGNPWIFAHVKACLSGDLEPEEPTAAERIAMARRHAELLDRSIGRNIVRMRKHAMWYMHGLPGAAAARARINMCTTLDEFNAVFDELEERVEDYAARSL